MNLKELIAQKQALEEQIAQARKQESSNALAQVKSLVAEFGFTADDIFSGRSKSASGVKKGTKVAPKYRDPVTGATWTGRGIAPRWLTGKNKDDFKI